MQISRNILKTLFDDPVPSADKLGKGLTMHAFEVEGIEHTGDDDVLSIDILPNRAHDCLSHYGIAGEVSRIFDVAQTKGFEKVELEEKKRGAVSIEIEDKLADRFVITVVENLDRGESPQWLKDALTAFGERPISPIVDIMNYVMFLTGQPLHAYDLDALKEKEGDVHFAVREARAGETFASLEGGEMELEGGELVIAGSQNVLGLAGVKGGASTAVSDKTKRIALEAATFSPVRVRRTAQDTKIKTHASKRFENGISPELASLGTREAVRLLKECFPTAEITSQRDEYVHATTPSSIELDVTLPSRLLGVDVAKETVVTLLRSVGCEVEENGATLMVTPPFERLDLSAPEDLIEEVGRLYGYKHVEPAELPEHARDPDTAPLKTELALKRLLTSKGYSEIITRAFRNVGDIEIANPLANQEPFLRTELTSSALESLEMNARNAELIGKEVLRIFEIGAIFPSEGERKSLMLGITSVNGAQEKTGEDAFKEEAETLLSDSIGISKDDVRNARMTSTVRDRSIVLEFNYTALLDTAKTSEDIVTSREAREPFTRFSDFSRFPFVLRDIAVWTPEGTAAEDVSLIIKESAGDLLQRTRLFDRFEKTFDDGTKRVSYAYRLVFQSFERTLSDDEVNTYMKAIESALLENEGFEIR